MHSSTVQLLVVLLAFVSLWSITTAQEQQQQQENLLQSIALGQIDTAYRLLAQGHNPNVAEQVKLTHSLTHFCRSSSDMTT